MVLQLDLFKDCPLKLVIKNAIVLKFKQQKVEILKQIIKYQEKEKKMLNLNYKINNQLVSHKGQIFHEADMRAEYTYNYKSTDNQPIYVCFQSQDKKGKLINFNWRNIVEDEFVGIDTISESVRAAQQANRRLESIYIYYQRDYQRLVTHSKDIFLNQQLIILQKVLKRTSKKVKWMYILKMILLIIVAIIEVIMIIKPFKKLQQEYINI